ncbi:hypothetical protein HYU06_07345 [Candidatus Woesearchaeota archaeon]|nr:hypothetical protein [Candidatus Woesearchaeota archaeon]
MPANPGLPKILNLTFTSGTQGQIVKLVNRTTDEIVFDTLNASGKLLFDCNSFTSGYTDGDVIDIVLSGERSAATTITLSGEAAQSSTITTTAGAVGARRGF